MKLTRLHSRDPRWILVPSLSLSSRTSLHYAPSLASEAGSAKSQPRGRRSNISLSCKTLPPSSENSQLASSRVLSMMCPVGRQPWRRVGVPTRGYASSFRVILDRERGPNTALRVEVVGAKDLVSRRSALLSVCTVVSSPTSCPCLQPASTSQILLDVAAGFACACCMDPGPEVACDTVGTASGARATRTVRCRWARLKRSRAQSTQPTTLSPSPLPVPPSLLLSLLSRLRVQHTSQRRSPQCRAIDTSVRRRFGARSFSSSTTRTPQQSCELSSETRISLAPRCVAEYGNNASMNCSMPTLCRALAGGGQRLRQDGDSATGAARGFSAGTP